MAAIRNRRGNHPAAVTIGFDAEDREAGRIPRHRYRYRADRFPFRDEFGGQGSEIHPLACSIRTSDKARSLAFDMARPGALACKRAGFTTLARRDDASGLAGFFKGPGCCVCGNACHYFDRTVALRSAETARNRISIPDRLPMQMMSGTNEDPVREKPASARIAMNRTPVADQPRILVNPGS